MKDKQHINVDGEIFIWEVKTDGKLYIWKGGLVIHEQQLSLSTTMNKPKVRRIIQKLFLQPHRDRTIDIKPNDGCYPIEPHPRRKTRSYKKKK